MAGGSPKGLSKKPPLCGPIGVLGLAWLSRARGCGMAMGVLRGQESTLQVAIVCLDELVPEDCRYRKLDRLVDWTFVREAASPYYADEVGRPSVDPIVLVKLLVAGALEGIGSARELCRVAGLRLDLRRFLGYGFHERLPAHQTLSHAQTRRFVDGALFERLFLRSLDLCKQHGLVDGTHLSVDGFHAEANAALASLRASLALVAVEEPGADEPGDRERPEPSASPQLALAEPRSGPTPKRRSSNASSVSRTDPEAKLRGKPGQRPHLVYRGQVAVDPKARCGVRLPRRAGGRLRGRRARPDPRPCPLRLSRARLGWRRLRLRRRARLARPGSARPDRLHPAAADNAARRRADQRRAARGARRPRPLQEQAGRLGAQATDGRR